MFEITTTPLRPLRPPLQAGLLASFLVHALCVAAVVAVVACSLWFGSGASENQQITVRASFNAEKAEPRAEVKVVSDPSEVTGEMVDDRLNEVIAESQQRSDAENLDRLTALAQRLESVSTTQSVDELTNQFHKWLGTAPRASQPASEPVAGPFDFDTAQFHDVRRETDGQGGWRYLGLLLDANGRVIEVEMDAESGETLFQTMERLKSFPLLDKVYRQIAMPLIDNLIQAGRQAEDAQRQYEQQTRKATTQDETEELRQQE